MATLRGSQTSYDIGNKPPTVIWTVVRGDTSGFKVYVTDDAKEPLILKGEGSEWDIAMKIKRPFDIQVSDPTRVWTVCQGSMKILEDVTD
jgi:hypothetical protein